MSVLVNFKICVHDKKCGGAAVCPTGALYWDEVTQTIEIDNSKCISCGLCEKECPIGAIAVAKTNEEHSEIQKKIEVDPRTTKDLFVDYYGTAAISEFFKIKVEEIEQRALKECLTLVEVYNPNIAESTFRAIPIKELTKDLPLDTLYYKTESKEPLKKYGIQVLPALLLFQKGRLLGSVQGYCNMSQKGLLIEQMKRILS